jgi:hypothetical protein
MVIPLRGLPARSLFAPFFVWLPLALSLGACAEPKGPTPAADTGPAEAAPPVEPPAVDPLRALTRLSLDLRGVRPSVAEITAVQADPAALDALREAMLADPRWSERLVSAFQEEWTTVQDEAEHPAATFGLADEPAFARAVGEEPLRLMAHVAAEDLPWTTVVTADFTLVDANLAAAWPVEPIEPPGEGWAPARYTDGRPAAGVLVTNGLWWRYETSPNNASRARANQVSRLLLCRDYLSQPVTFDRSLDLADPEVARAALQSNPGCVSCHSSLDPLASLLGGVYFSRKSGPEEMLRYHAEREGIWREQTGVPPAYFGQPAETLLDLGQRLAADPGFVDCAVEQAAAHLLRRPLGLDDSAARDRYREAFLGSGLRLRALWDAILRDPLYLGPAAGAAVAPGQVAAKLLSPDQLSSQIEDLTGYRFVVDGADLLRTSDRGLATLAGGSDGRYARGLSQTWSATQVLVVERVALLAADALVQGDWARLLTVDPRTPVEGEALRAALADLHLRVLSQPAGPEGLQQLAEHHAAVAAEAGPAAAWTSVISVLMRDPEFLVY